MYQLSPYSVDFNKMTDNYTFYKTVMVNQFLICDQHAVFTERISYFISFQEWLLIFHDIISKCNRCQFVCHYKLNTYRQSIYIHWVFYFPPSDCVRAATDKMKSQFNQFKLHVLSPHMYGCAFLNFFITTTRQC